MTVQTLESSLPSMSGAPLSPEIIQLKFDHPANDATLEEVIRMHWFTLETGLAIEDGRAKAYGAAILSSQEMEHRVTRATLRPFDIEAICGTSFEPTVLQDQLFLSESLDYTVATVSAWLDTL